ncbi:Gti1/Pac2 family-domain-containing protein [Scleroderma yunnanense]
MSANQQISSPSSAGATAATPAPNQQPSPTTWTEPPWSGWIETTGDALLILEAARRGLIPRVTRRLVDSERKMITSGSVFVFDEDESGIKRWTDGFFWSPSRILGNFLLYRETDKRGAGHRGARSDSADDHQYNDGTRPDGHSLSRPKGETSSSGLERHRERVLVGSLTNSYKFKTDGLMKKTFSLTIGGVAQHLISYYKIEDVEQGRLRSPSSLPELASLDITPEYLDKTHFRNPPKVEIGVDGVPRYRGEADDIDPSPSLLAAPLSTGLPLLTDGRVSDGSKRGRYNPYSNGSSKRKRGGKGGTGSQSNSPTDNQTVTLPIPSPSTPTSSHSHLHSQGPPPSSAPSTSYNEHQQTSSIGAAGAQSHPPPHPPYVTYPVGYYGAGVPGVPHPQQIPPPPVSSTTVPYTYPGPASPYGAAPPPPPDSHQGVMSPPQTYYSYYPHPPPPHSHPPHPPYGGYPPVPWSGYNGYSGHVGHSPATSPTGSIPGPSSINELPEKGGDTPSSREVGREGSGA